MGQLSRVGVIGAGNMGAGIAQKCAQEGLEVVLIDINQELVQRGIDGIASLLQQGVSKKVFTPDQVEATLSRLKPSTDISDLQNCQVVIEAVFEDFEVKRRLFKQVDKVVDSKTVLATNTSSHSVSELAGVIKNPERFVGLHFFFHSAKNRLLEIIPGEKTNEESIALCEELAAVASKDEIFVADAPGFAVNRFFVPWLNEATRLLDEGVANIPTIEVAAKKAFKIGLGPFELMNLSGIPIALHSTETLGAKLGDFYSPSQALKTQYSKKQPWPLEGEVDEGKLNACQDRLLGVVFYVCCQMLDEKVCGMSEIDLGAKVGLRWALGPFELMNKIGNEKVADLVNGICGQHTFLTIPQALKKRLSFGDAWPVRYVDLKIEGNLAQIIFQRPEAMNALNEAVVAQLGKAFDKANANPKVETIVLRGKGKAFVAGADIGFFLKQIKGNTVHRIREFAGDAQDVFLRMEASPKWVVCLMDGLALGGGAELALACDTIIATPKASLGFPETGIGIYPGLGGTQRSLRAVGLPLAKYLVMTGKVLSAAQAHEVGLVEYLVPQGEAMNKIRELAGNNPLTKKTAEKPVLNGKWAEITMAFEDPERLESLLNGAGAEQKDTTAGKVAGILSKKAPLAIRWAGEIMDQGSKVPLKDGLKLELDRLEAMFKTKDALEGLSSLVERRRPQFTAE